MQQVTGLLVGGAALSVIHALIPNHWLPFVLLGASQRWSRSRLVAITALGGFFHVLSTILIGVFVGLAGYELSRRQEMVTQFIAPAILVALGVGLIIANQLGRGHRHRHFLPYEHDHEDAAHTAHAHEDGGDAHPLSHRQSQSAATLTHRQATVSVAGIVAAMFFSPCIELEAYYFWAGGLGWFGIGALSAVYLVVTVGLMIVLVVVATERFGKRLRFLEHHERLVVGAIFVVLGVVAYFIA